MMTEKFSSKLKHAFSVKQEPLTEEEIVLLEKAAGIIARNKMQSAAILALQSLTPLSFIGSQAFIIVSPFLDPFVSADEQAKFTKILEHRDGIEILIQKIEEKKS